MLNVKATVVKDGEVIADCVPGNLDGILLFQKLDQLGSRERVFCVGVMKEVLVQI